LPERRRYKATTWWSAFLPRFSNPKPVRDIADPKEPNLLTERLSRTIETAFCPDDAEKLTSILLDWTKHTNDQQVKDILTTLLRKCEQDGSARFLRGATELLSRASLRMANRGEVNISGTDCRQEYKLTRLPFATKWDLKEYLSMLENFVPAFRQHVLGEID
jgi:hypothetical protein